MTLDDLYKIIEDRKKSMPENSYVASLFNEGNDRIIQKVGEEATEAVIAAKNNNKSKLVSEVADLLFHILIMLVAYEIKPRQVLEEFDKRRKISK